MIFLSLLATSFAFADDPCADTDALQVQCHSQVCSSRTTMPLDPEILARASAAHNYTPPAEFAGQLSEFQRATDSISRDLGRLDERAVAREVDAVIQDPLNRLETFKYFLSDNFQETPAGSIRNNMVPRDPEIDSLNDKIDHIQYVQGYLSRLEKGYTLYPGEETMLLSALNSGGGRFTAPLAYSPAIRTTWEQSARSQLLALRPQLISVTRKKITEALDFPYARRSAEVLANCRTLEYLRTQSAAVTQAQFQRLVSNTTNNFTSRLRGRLTPECAATIDSRITASTFELDTQPIPPRIEFPIDDLRSARTVFDRARALKDTARVGCEFPREIFSDQLSPYSGKLVISPLSVAMSFGDVVTHEMGHLFSEIMAAPSSPCANMRARFQNLRDCISRFSSTKPSDFPDRQPGDRFRTEENFADWFAGVVNPGPTQTGCDMKVMNRLAQRDLSERPYTPNEDDPHSPSLFRQLHMMVLRQEPIPQSCLELMNNSEERPERCEL